MDKNSGTDKVFVKEALGSRNYISYRIDLLLYKLFFSIASLIGIYILTNDVLLAILFFLLTFAISTLFNKLSLNKKIKLGEKLFVENKKALYTKQKLDELNVRNYYLLMQFIYEKEGYKNFANKEKHIFLANKDKKIYCFKFHKLIDEMEIEKDDAKSLIEFMTENNIKTGFLLCNGKFSEEALNLIDKVKNKLEINVVDINELYKMMDKYNLLPSNEIFLREAKDKKIVAIDRKNMMTNVFSNKKIFVYILAAIFFFIYSNIYAQSELFRYVFYYFTILSLINLLYIFWYKEDKIVQDKINN